MTDGDWFEQRFINGVFRQVAYIETIQMPLVDGADELRPTWPHKRSLCLDIERGMGIPAYVVWHNEDCTEFLVQRISHGVPRRMSESEYAEFIRTIGGRSLFAKDHDLEEVLSFEETEERIFVKPVKFLGTEKFRRIVEIVKKFGGEYVSAGKDSYFMIPKKLQAKESASTSLITNFM